MKITKSRLRQIIQEEVNEYADGAGSVGSSGVGGSYGSTGVVDTSGAGNYDLTTHAEGIASSYGKSDDEEVKEKIAAVLEKMIGEDTEPDEANSMITDMLYQLVDKDTHEEDPMDEGGKGKLSGKGIPYDKATGAGKYPDVNDPKSRKQAKRSVAKSRRRDAKDDIDSQLSEAKKPTKLRIRIQKKNK